MSLWRSLGQWMRRRRYGDTPSYRIHELPDHTFGRLTGVIALLDDTTLQAPLSYRACVYHGVVIDDYRTGAMNGVELADKHEAVPFLLVDGEHEAVIDPTHALISAPYDHVTEGKPGVDMHPREQALLDRYGLSARSWYDTRYVRFCEAVLVPGERITVIGSGEWERDPGGPGDHHSYRERGPTRLRMAGSATAPLLISNRAKRGRRAIRARDTSRPRDR